MDDKQKSKKVKLDSKGKGSSEDDLNLDDLDFEEMDFGEFEDIPDDRKPSKAGVAKELGKEAGKGFLNSLVTNTAKKSLPSEYEHNYSEAMEYVDFTKETYERNREKINASLFKLTKEVQKILPFKLKAMDNYIEKRKAEQETDAAMSEEAARNASIESSLTGIFDKQLEIQKDLEARSEAKDEVERKERLVTNKLNIDKLTSIDNSLSNLTAFTLQISKEYYRKSLELQFKTYFIQADMLKTMKDSYKAFSLQFDSIAKNTGLPEFVKLKNTERLSEIIRTQTVQNIYGSLYTNNKYVADIKKRMSGYVNTKIDEQLEKVNNISDQLSMMNSMGGEGSGGGLGLVGSALSGTFGGSIGEAVSNRISPKIKDKIKDNRTINTGANYLEMLASSPSTFFSILREKVGKAREEADSDVGISGSIKKGFFGGLADFLRTTENNVGPLEVKDSNILMSHANPAIFDNRVHRSITEIIPLYLSNILRQNTDLTNMYHRINGPKLGKDFKLSEGLEFDFYSKKLVTRETIVKNIEENVMPKRSSDRALESIGNTILSSSKSTAEKDKKANKADIALLDKKQSQTAMSNYVKRAAKIEGLNLSQDTLVNNLEVNTITGKITGIKDKRFEDLTKAERELLSMISDDKTLASVISVIQRHKADDKLKKDIDLRLEDSSSTYPTLALIKLIQGASNLSGNNKLTTQVSKEEASILAEAFSKYIYSKGLNDITLDEIVKGLPIKTLTQKKTDKIKDLYSIFVYDIAKVKATNNPEVTSKLEVLLGLMNKSLKENAEIDPGVFQTLQDLYPGLVGKGSLTAKNIFENKIKIETEEDEETVSQETIRDIIRTPKIEIENMRQTKTTTSLFSGLAAKSEAFKKDILEAKGNPLAISRAVLAHTKKAIVSAREQINKGYEKASESVSEISTQLQKAVGDGKGSLTKEALTRVVGLVDNSVKNIQGMIVEEEQAKAKELSDLNEALSKVSTITDDGKAKKEIEKQITSVGKYYDTTIKALKSLEATVNKQKTNMQNMLSSGSAEIDVNLVTTLRNTANTCLEEVRTLINTYKQEREKLDTEAKA